MCDMKCEMLLESSIRYDDDAGDPVLVERQSCMSPRTLSVLITVDEMLSEGSSTEKAPGNHFHVFLRGRWG